MVYGNGINLPNMPTSGNFAPTDSRNYLQAILQRYQQGQGLGQMMNGNNTRFPSAGSFGPTPVNRVPNPAPLPPPRPTTPITLGGLLTNPIPTVAQGAYNAAYNLNEMSQLNNRYPGLSPKQLLAISQAKDPMAQNALALQLSAMNQVLKYRNDPVPTPTPTYVKPLAERQGQTGRNVSGRGI